MRFVDVNPFFYPHHGGIETRMHDTARLLAARGHDVTVLTGRLPDTAEEEMTEFGYRVVRLKSRFINIYNPPYISSEGVLEALESIDADVVNYNYRWAPSYNKDLKRYDGRKVFTYHNMWGEGTGIQAKLSEMNDIHIPQHVGRGHRHPGQAVRDERQRVQEDFGDLRPHSVRQLLCEG